MRATSGHASELHACLSRAAHTIARFSSRHALSLSQQQRQGLASSSGNCESRTSDVALSDHGTVGSYATNSLSKLLDSCLVELASIDGREDASKLSLEELAACSVDLSDCGTVGSYATDSLGKLLDSCLVGLAEVEA